VLPLGAECDSCNEYAGRLEKALVHHNRIGPVILLSGIPGKRGRPRERLGRIARKGDGFSLHQRDLTKITFGPGRVDIEVADAAEFGDLKFRRRLYHMAFNYFAWKRGVDYVLDARFDDVRRYVRRAQSGEAWPYAQVQYPDDRPNFKLSLTLLDQVPGCVVRFVSFLDEFYVDLLNTGSLHTWARENLPEHVGLL
jgi:hypothetical protein